jgi:AcrR family transcriptional regulator
MTSEPRRRGGREGDEPSAALSAVPRPPRQERGLRRVDAILDAAAALIAEEGIAGVTMHRVARRSGTTTGSMYHFFPDRDALLRGLAERHRAALRELVTRVERENAGTWARLTTDQAVGCFLEPFQSYLDRHPDLVPLSRLARAAESGVEHDAELSRSIVGLAEAVVASRGGAASPAEVASRAVAMTAMAEGMATAAALRAVPPDALRRELRRAIVAYLDSYAPG